MGNSITEEKGAYRRGPGDANIGRNARDPASAESAEPIRLQVMTVASE